MPWKVVEAVAETLEVLEDKELLGQLRQSRLEMDSDKLVPWLEAKQELGLCRGGLA